jgi:hypothetical protein
MATRRQNATCVNHSIPMDARTQNASQHMMFKPIPCQEGHKNYIYMCLPNLSHASVDRKSISTSVDQTPHVPARTQKFISTCVDLNLPCQRGQKIHRNMCLTKLSNASEDTNCISTRVD